MTMSVNLIIAKIVNVAAPVSASVKKMVRQKFQGKKPIDGLGGTLAEYPRYFGGVYWYDQITFRANREGRCFICKQATLRIDVCFEAYYCGSLSCTETIENDLRKANKIPREEATT